MRHESIERLGILQKEAIVDHSGVVFRQSLCAIARGDKLQTATYLSIGSQS